MNQLNNTTDVQKYLESGPMTQSFLKDKNIGFNNGFKRGKKNGKDERKSKQLRI